MPYHGKRFISRERKIKTRTAKTENKERERERETREKVKSTGRGPEIPTYLREIEAASERETDRVI